jgi:Protein of unknown function (DUF2510)
VTQASPQDEQVPSGWYPNPEGKGQRYWDGSRWTDDYWPAQRTSSTGRSRPRGTLLLTFLFGLAVGALFWLPGVVSTSGYEFWPRIAGIGVVITFVCWIWSTRDGDPADLWNRWPIAALGAATPLAVLFVWLIAVCAGGACG